MKIRRHLLCTLLMGCLTISTSLACETIPVPSDTFKLGQPTTKKTFIIQEYDRNGDGIADMAIGFMVPASGGVSIWPTLYFLGSEENHVRFRDIGTPEPQGRCEDIIIDPTSYRLKDLT